MGLKGWHTKCDGVDPRRGRAEAFAPIYPTAATTHKIFQILRGPVRGPPPSPREGDLFVYHTDSNNAVRYVAFDWVAVPHANVHPDAHAAAVA